MNGLNRRIFVKTLLTTAAYSSSAHAAMRAGFAIPDETEGNSADTDIEFGGQRLRISPAGAPLTFQNFLRTENAWKPATMARVPLIAGPSFSLIPSRVQRDGLRVRCEGKARAKDVDGKPLPYDWDAEITALVDSRSDPRPDDDADRRSERHAENRSENHAEAPPASWIRFRTTLHLPAPMRLQQGSSVEPQIITWLSATSTLMEGQSGSWRRVLLEQPTRNSIGTYGNDLPAVYLLDQNVGVETLMYFDVGDMSWMSTENLPRFLVYRCSSISHIERDGIQRLGVGLLAAQATGDVLPQGDINFTYYLLQRPMTRLLSAQQAVARWMEALLPRFEEKLRWPDCATSWKEFATGTVEDLQNKNAALIETGGHTGLRAYVKASSKLWNDSPDNFELMAVADVLWPSLLYNRLHPSQAFESECKELLADLPAFYHPDTHSISNDFARKTNERADSWYPFENSLVKYSIIGSLTGSKELIDDFLDAFHSAQKLAQRYDYLFPIYFQVATLQAEGAGTNYAIGGLYAWAAIRANKLTGEKQYLDEARRAIDVLYTVPPERLFHEPQELAYGALAAAELGMTEEAKFLLYQQLRMFYWYSDPSQKTHDIRGMVQACASILYPAFKENVEAILPWTGVMKRGIIFEGLLRFMDQQRRNNFYFFENCAANRKREDSAFIPFENLGTLELAGMTGNVGKEIYGAGESIWMYLMFEALGHVSDRELMLVNLDLLDAVGANEFPPQNLNFILFNPTAVDRSASIDIPWAKTSTARLSVNGKPSASKLQIPKQSFIKISAEF